MNSRIKFARILQKLGVFIQSLAVVVMKPDDLVEYSRLSYANPQAVNGWAEDDIVNSGLSEDEESLLKYLPETNGKLLILGVGGGREAIPLARLGFNVTGLDYVAEMVERSITNASRKGFHIEGLVQEISNLDTPSNMYDVVWLSRSMYSCVPTRARRVKMLKKIVKTLKPGGYFFCQYYMDRENPVSKKWIMLHKLFAAVSFGNMEYEKGDKLNENVEFIHAFSSDEELRLELVEGGLSVIDIRPGKTLIRSCVICRKDPG